MLTVFHAEDDHDVQYHEDVVMEDACPDDKPVDPAIAKELIVNEVVARMEKRLSSYQWEEVEQSDEHKQEVKKLTDRVEQEVYSPVWEEHPRLFSPSNVKVRDYKNKSLNPAVKLILCELEKAPNRARPALLGQP